MGRFGLPIVLALLVPASLHAATPESGTINDDTHSITFTGGPFLINNPSPDTTSFEVTEEPVCPETAPGAEMCDEFFFEVRLSDVDADSGDLFISVGWPTAEADFDIYLYDAESGARISESVNSSSTNPEAIFVPIANGKYRLLIVPYQPLGDSYEGKVEFQSFGKSSFGFFAGSLGAPLLLVLAGLAAARIRRRARLH